MDKIVSLKNMWHRFFAVALCTSAPSMVALATQVNYGGIDYDLDEDGVAYAIGYDGVTANVILVSHVVISGKEYQVINPFDISLSAQDNIVSIDASQAEPYISSLSGCRNLVTVKFPDSQTYLPEYQFYDCPSLDLRSVLTPNIEYTGEYCFAMSEPTPMGTFDNIDIRVCGYNALKNRLYSTVIVDASTGSLSDFEVQAIKTLDARGFTIRADWDSQFESLETLILTDGSIFIDDFFPNIKSVTLKGSIDECSIRPYSTALDNLEIDFSNATQISECNISNITSVASLNMAGKVRNLSVSKMPALVTLTGLEGVTTAYIQNCNALTKIELPDIEEFGSEAFAYNTSLKEVYLGDKLREISNRDTFYKCNSLEDLIFGGSIEQWLGIVQWIDESESSSAMLNKVPNFWYGHGNAKMTKLTELNASHVGDCDKIGIGAFTGYKGLTKIDLPASVKSIGTSAFANCANLTDINIRAERIDQHAFLSCNAINNITISDHLNYIGPAFSNFGYQNQATVNFLGTPNQWMKIVRTSVSYLDPWNPEGGEGVSRFGTPAIRTKELLFNGSLVENLIVEDIEQITNAFAGDKTLKTLTIKCAGTFPKIQSGAFAGCTQLGVIAVEYTAPRSANFEHADGFEVGEEAFRGCQALKEIGVLDYIKTIGKNALLGTQWLNDRPADEVVYLTTERGETAYTYNGIPRTGTKLVIKEGCEAINSMAFDSPGASDEPDFSGFCTIDIPASVKYIGYEALDGIRFNGDFTLPATVEEIGSNSFNGEIDTFTFEESPVELKSPDEVQSNLYLAAVKNLNYNRNFDSNISVQGLVGCSEVKFGSDLTEVTDMMTVPYSATKVYSFSANPPACGFTTSIWNPGTLIYPQFSSVDFDKCVLYVPAGSEEAYRNADGWSMFTQIQAYSSGVECISSDNADTRVLRHYDISGRALSPDAKGLHIVVDSDGKTTKQIVK